MATIKVSVNCTVHHQESVAGETVEGMPSQVQFQCSDFAPKAEIDPPGTSDTTVTVVARLKESDYCRGRCSNSGCERLRV